MTCSSAGLSSSGSRVHACRGGLQSRVPAAASGRGAMTVSGHALLGRWRIGAADLWESDYLDLAEPAALVVRADGQGEIAFGALQASLDVDYGPTRLASP